MCVCLFDLSAGGAPDPQWNRPQPGPAADPERDGAEEGEDPRFRSVWDSLQGQCVCTEANRQDKCWRCAFLYAATFTFLPASVFDLG